MSPIQPSSQYPNLKPVTLEAIQTCWNLPQGTSLFLILIRKAQFWFFSTDVEICNIFKACLPFKQPMHSQMIQPAVCKSWEISYYNLNLMNIYVLYIHIECMNCYIHIECMNWIFGGSFVRVQTQDLSGHVVLLCQFWPFMDSLLFPLQHFEVTFPRTYWNRLLAARRLLRFCKAADPRSSPRSCMYDLENMNVYCYWFHVVASIHRKIDAAMYFILF